MDAAWIDTLSELWKRDDDIEFVRLETQNQLKPLHRCGAPAPQSLLICLTGFGDQRDDIADTITSNGGRYTGDLTRKCTHLIVGKPEGKNFTAAKSWNVYTVTLDWLHQSVQRGMILDEALFDPLLPPEQQGVGAWLKKDPRPSSLGKRPNNPDGGARKLRKTASMKLNSQRDNIWGDILRRPTSRHGSSTETQREEAPDHHVPSPETVPSHDPAAIFSNCVFAIHGFDKTRRKVLDETVTNLGGTIAPSVEAIASRPPHAGALHRFLIVPQTSQPDTHPRIPHDDVHIVTEFYIERCLHSKRFSPPAEHVLGRPFPRFPIRGFSDLTVCSAAFTGLELSQMARSVAQLGAKFDEEFRRSTSLVVCKSLQAMRKEKLQYALDWKVPVVSADWLWECISTGFNVPVDCYILPESQRRHACRKQSVRAEETVTGSSGPPPPQRSGSALPVAEPGIARPPARARLDAIAFERDSPDTGRKVAQGDSATSADFMTARTRPADTFAGDSDAPLGELSARLNKPPPSPPKHTTAPTRTRSEPWARPVADKAAGSDRGPSAPPADPPRRGGGAGPEADGDGAERRAVEEARRQAREAERQALSSRLSSLIRSTTTEAEPHESSRPPSTAAATAAGPRRRQVLGRAVSNASNASSSAATVAGGSDDEDAGGPRASPPPATQLEYRDPQVLESKAALVSKMMMVAGAGAGAGAGVAAAAATRPAGVGVGVGVAAGRALRKR